MSQEPAFRRNIGLFLAVMIGIVAMMGPGIFALPGEVPEMVGPLGVLVYLVMGLLTVFTALNYSELGAATRPEMSLLTALATSVGPSRADCQVRSRVIESV